MSEPEDYSVHVKEMLKPRVQHTASMDQMNEFRAEAERVRKIREEAARHELEMRKLESDRRRKG